MSRSGSRPAWSRCTGIAPTRDAPLRLVITPAGSTSSRSFASAAPWRSTQASRPGRRAIRRAPRPRAAGPIALGRRPSVVAAIGWDGESSDVFRVSAGQRHHQRYAVHFGDQMVFRACSGLSGAIGRPRWLRRTGGSAGDRRAEAGNEDAERPYASSTRMTLRSISSWSRGSHPRRTRTGGPAPPSPPISS
jgi:hypothetical protein